MPSLKAWDSAAGAWKYITQNLVSSNPTAQVSGTAVNGSASTFMRSDAAPALANTAVTAGSYGSASQVGRFVVDAQGRITAASNVAISGGSGSSASTITEVKNVKDYGAVGDGTTDDTTAIQNAINALPAHGGIVYLPPGRYKITATLTIGNGTSSAMSTKHGIMLWGSGTGATGGDQELVYGYTLLIWAGASGGTVISVAGPISHVTIRDIAIECANLAGVGMLITHAFQSLFENISIRRFTSVGIDFTTHVSHPVTSAGAMQNIFANVFAQTSNSSTIGWRIGPASAGTFSPCQNLYLNGRAMMLSPGTNMTALQLRFTDSSTFVDFLVQAQGTGSIGLQAVVPSGGTTFPKAMMFYNCPIIGGTSISGTWTGSDKFFFLPYPTEDGEITPTASIFAGVLATGRWFGLGYQHIPLTTPLTSTSFDGDNIAVGTTVVDTSASFGAPAGIKAANVLVAATWTAADANSTLALRPTGGTVNYAVLRAHNTWQQVMTVVIPCNANGDFDVIVAGATANGVVIRILGYYL